ncbi:MAG: ComF family protein [Kiritimatiellae bacterium]|nr:ComF family protein [Kiritimatiellia bacterium]MDW8458297.1 ComF family protein [Verrucomicrobiota bacterium]
MATATEWIWATLDLMYPRCCGACGAPIAEGPGFLCWPCRESLRPIGEPCCSRCGNPIEGRADHEFVCAHCDEMKPYFDLARSAVRFEGAAVGAVYTFKYRGGIWLQEELIQWLEACWTVWFCDGPRPDFVCPVPLHPARERARGFNQATLLSAGLARRIGCPHLPGALVRVRPTETQTHLTAKQRLSNVQEAFKAPSPARIRGQRALLVDDVMTTGATVSACARALKAAGCISVSVLTLARGQ